MKFGTLRAIAHNVADSLGSGIGMLLGVYEMDVLGEAARNPQGFIRVDFLMGTATHGGVSPSLTDAIAKYRAALPELCAKHGASIDDFRELSARYFAAGLSRRIAVTIEDRNGPRPEHEYLGIPVRRAKVMDRLGRIRTNRRGSSR